MYPGNIEQLTIVHRFEDQQRAQALEFRRLREAAHVERAEFHAETARKSKLGLLDLVSQGHWLGKARSRLDPLGTAR